MNYKIFILDFILGSLISLSSIWVLRYVLAKLFSTVSLKAVLRNRIRRIRIILGLMDPDPLMRSTDQDPAADPDLDSSIIKQKKVRNPLIPTFCDCLITFYHRKMMLRYRYLQKVISKKTVGVLKFNDVTAGSGSISQRHGSADPDPYQNVADPQ
jgi:hypothetical protein